MNVSFIMAIPVQNMFSYTRCGARVKAISSILTISAYSKDIDVQEGLFNKSVSYMLTNVSHLTFWMMNDFRFPTDKVTLGWQGCAP